MRKPLIEIEVDAIQLPNLEAHNAMNKEKNKANMSLGNLDFPSETEHMTDGSCESLEGQIEKLKKSSPSYTNQLNTSLSTEVIHRGLFSDEEIHQFLNEAEQSKIDCTHNWSSSLSITSGVLGELKDHEIQEFLNDFLLECTTYIDNLC